MFFVEIRLKEKLEIYRSYLFLKNSLLICVVSLRNVTIAWQAYAI